jgi:hypothetical protein
MADMNMTTRILYNAVEYVYVSPKRESRALTPWCYWVLILLHMLVNQGTKTILCGHIIWYHIFGYGYYEIIKHSVWQSFKKATYICHGINCVYWFYFACGVFVRVWCGVVCRRLYRLKGDDSSGHMCIIMSHHYGGSYIPSPVKTIHTVPTYEIMSIIRAL